MTKVLRIITRLNIGGPAIHVTNLNYYLDKDYGYQSTLVYGSLAEGEGSMEYLATDKNLKMINIPALGREVSPLNDLKIVFKLLKIIKKERPEIIHTHTAKAGMAGRLAAFLARVPKRYHTFHGHVFHGYFGNLKTKIFILIEKVLAKMSTKIIAISEKQKAELLQYKICRADKIKVIPLGFDLNALQQRAEPGFLRNKFNIDQETKVVGIVGRLVPIKQHEYFIEIAEKVLQQRTAVKFLIVGDGEIKGELQKKIDEKGLQDQIIITGFINDVAKVYPDLDVVALTSKNEGTPVTLIEALSFGKPVISTNVGGIADVLANGEYGWLEEQGNPNKFAEDLITILNNFDSAKAKALKGKEFVFKKYDVSRLVKDIYNLYI